MAARSDETLLLDAVPFVERVLAAGHGEKHARVAEACAALGGISTQTFYRLAERAVVGRQRKRRCDAGEMALTREEALLVSAYMMSAFRRTGRGICTLKDALRELRANGVLRGERVDEVSGEIVALSESTVARALRAYELHPEQLNRPTPHANLRSPRPNWCWQMDASVCVIYYLPKGGAMIREMREDEFYSGKPDNWAKISGNMVIRYLMTDHRTDMRRLAYVQGAESGEHAADHLINCMQKPDDARGMLWGVPKYLMVDPGSAQTGRKFRRLCQRLGIELIINKAGNARAKGQVEQGHNRVELEFEHGLKFLREEIRGVEDLNRLAFYWQRHHNATEAHSRYDQPRWSAWLAIEPQHLVTAPSVAVCRDLAINDPASRRVNGDLMVSFEGEFYSVASLPGIKVKDEVKVCLNPWRLQDGIPEVVAVDADENGHEIHYPLPHQARDALNQFVNAATIGEHFKSPADTVADTNRKEVTKLIAGENTLEAAEKKLRKNSTVPLAQFAIDPLKTAREAELPAGFERGSTMHPLADGAGAVERVEPPLPMIDTLIALRDALGRPLTVAENAFLSRRFADGATRTQIVTLVAQFAGAGVEDERKVG